MHPILRLLSTALFTATSLAAQVTPVKGAGCPGSIPVKTSGAARLGQSFVLQAATCARGSAGFLAIGIPAEPAIVVEGSPLCFLGRPCVLVVDPLHVAVDTNLFRLDVPDLAGFLGLGFRVQTGCFDRTAACIVLGAAVDVVIER